MPRPINKLITKLDCNIKTTNKILELIPDIIKQYPKKCLNPKRLILKVKEKPNV